MTAERIAVWATLAATILGAGFGYGQQAEKINQLEQRVGTFEQLKEQSAEVQSDVARVDERTKAIQEGQQRQEVMLQMLLERIQ